MVINMGVTKITLHASLKNKRQLKNLVCLESALEVLYVQSVWQGFLRAQTSVYMLPL